VLIPLATVQRCNGQGRAHSRAVRYRDHVEQGYERNASRLLIDKLAHSVKRILVLHDFDVTGFSIFGTLGTNNRRYTFENVAPLIDIGLRLDDVGSMNLEFEPVTISVDWRKRAATLRRHGATEEEIAFLRNRRVERNAMTSRQLVDFIEAKFAVHGVTKLIPNEAVIEWHARRSIEQELIERTIMKNSGEIAEQAKNAALPPNLRNQIKAALEENPAMPWDAAVAQIIHGIYGQKP
jgi:hypothetical protein